MHDRNGIHTGCSCSRRQLLKGGLAAYAAAFLAPPSGLWFPAVGPSRPYLDVARQAERWLAQSAKHVDGGTTWPWDPANAAQPDAVQLNLYTGMPGVVLFHLELHHATGDAAALAGARAGADYLAASMPNGSAADAGLYTGLAGMAYTLEMTHRATGESRYRAAAKRALTQLQQSAREVGGGVEWSDSTDIISGSAGIGLFLLWAREHMGERTALDLGVKAGRRLVERGQSERGGMKWMVSPTLTRNYPNFSHGTGGVSYFLATLYKATGERSFLEAAKAGATYLDAIATSTPNGGRMVFHSEPGNEQLFYLSWCHGPAGTARLYHRLSEIGGTGYRERVDQLAQAIVDMRVPDRSPGFWNNISQCCGNSGVVEFFIDLHRHTRDQRHLDFAERVTGDTLQRGTAEQGAMRWIQAENRVSPDVVIAQTGLMQGAAGVGIAMLHLDGVRQKRTPLVVLPDNPF